LATLILTGVAASGAIASTWLAFGALSSSQHAATAARDAADQAERQADFANLQWSATKETLRASIGAPELHVGVVSREGKQIKFWTPLLKNYGNTYADLETKSFCKEQTEEELRFEFPKEGKVDHMIIGPRDEKEGQPCEVGQDAWENTAKRRGNFFVFGEAEYRDIYATSHQTKWCGQIVWRGDNPADSILTYCKGVNAKYNCIDTQCGESQP
jgi:hypothetical protein